MSLMFPAPSVCVINDNESCVQRLNMLVANASPGRDIP